ncbi:MAG: hypothetical protein J5494_01605 [Candidatus Methanomethylophilaceae archaeon]|nr:hypothetical protein [Candidatus Methanomethylophilaceae archaeon]
MTNTDIRQTIEWTFRVRDEVTPAVSGIRKTAEEAEGAVDSLIYVQDSAVSSADTLNSTLTDLRAETSQTTSAMQKLGIEGESARNSLIQRRTELQSEAEALRKILSEDLSVPEPDLSKVREAVREAESLANVRIEIPEPDLSGLESADQAINQTQADFEELGRLLGIPLTGPEEWQTAVERAVTGIEAEIRDLDREIAESAGNAETVMRDHATRAKNELESVNLRARESAQSVGLSQRQARADISATDSALMLQANRIMLQMGAIAGLKEGVGSVINGITSLGLVSDETAQSLAKINSAFQLMAGAVSTIRAIQGAMTALNVATAINASLNSFNAVLANPAMAAGVGLAAGAALGVAGAYLMTQNNSQTTNNITIIDGSDRVETGTEIYDLVRGPAV